MEPCMVCGLKGKYKCSACGRVSYCSAKCQKEHWALHKGQCRALAQSGPQTAIVDALHDVAESAFVPSSQWLCSADRVAQLVDWEPHASIFSFSHIGVKNVGNTCFVNAVLQCVSYSPALCSYLQSKPHGTSCPRKNAKKFCIICVMAEWVHLLLQTPVGYVVVPVDILRNLHALSDQFVLGHQDDARDFFYHLIGAMQTALVQDSGRAAPIPHNIETTTLLHQLFGGFQCHRVRCAGCKYATAVKNFDYFLTLQLPVSAFGSLEETLHECYRSQRIDDWKCPKCGELKGIEDLCVYRSHALLVVVLMRFDLKLNKLNNPVIFRSQLDLKPVMYQETAEKEGSEYDLYGVVVHFGNTMRSGHYVSFVKVQGRWFLCDDEKVTEVPENVVLSQSAYMLFYRKRKTKPAAGAPAKAKQANASTPASAPSTAGDVGKATTASTPSSTNPLAASQDSEGDLSKSGSSLSTSTGALEAVAQWDKFVVKPEDVATFFDMSEEGGINRVFVRVKAANVTLSANRVKPVVKNDGSVSMDFGSSSFSFKLPFPVDTKSATNSCKYFVDERLLLLSLAVVHVESAAGESAAVEVREVHGAVDVVLEADNHMDVPVKCTVPSVEWSYEPSYKRLYDDIAKYSSVLESNNKGSGGQANAAVAKKKPAAPKRNEKCPCGSGLKYKACHEKLSK